MNKKYLENFDKKGFIILKKFISKKEINKIYSQMNEILNFVLTKNSVKFKKSMSIDEKYFILKKYSKNLKGHFYDIIRILDSFNNLVYSDKITAVIKKLLNQKLVLITNHRLRTDHKNEKANLPLHQEVNNISTDSALIFCPFVKTNKKTGGICLIPSSHKFGWLKTNESHLSACDHKLGIPENILCNKEKDANYGNLIVKKLFTKENIFFPNLDPGDMLIFRSKIFHGSTNYVEKGLRWSLIANYHRIDMTPYLSNKDFKSKGMELGMPMRISQKNLKLMNTIVE